MRITNNLSIIASTIALCALSLSPAQAAAPAETQRETSEAVLPITADANALLKAPRVAVTTTPKEVPAEAPPAVVPAATPAPTPPAPVAVQQTSVPVPAPTPPPAPPTVAVTVAPKLPSPVSGSGKGSIIASAALAQLGVRQDCTALVSNALAAAGIHFHGWPRDYFSLGSVVSASQALPGDLIYYDNAGAGMPHIAVYIGNGQAVHGGFNGSTVIASAQLGSGGTFIRV